MLPSIDACKRVRDLTRAAEWCKRTSAIARRFDDRFMFAVCRVHHADVLMWQERGEAERELATAADLFRAVGSGKEIDSVVRLAELRRRQGRVDEAAELLEDCVGHRLYDLHVGQLKLDAGAPGAASACASRFLRRVGKGDQFARVPGLELLVLASAQVGDIEAATRAATEIRATAGLVRTPPFIGSALLAEGHVAAARGEHALARARLEDAANSFLEAGAPFEAAQATRALAATLRVLGEEPLSRQADERARSALSDLGVAAPLRSCGYGVLSRRECEVLRLVAQGHSNDEIAAVAVLSVRTVERHVANVYAKLRLSGRSARAAATAWAHTHGHA